MDVALYDSTGELLLQHADMSTTNKNFALASGFVGGNTYYFRVYGGSTATAGRYGVKLVENRCITTLSNTNQDARKVAFQIQVPSIVDKLRVGIGSTTYTLNKTSDSPLRYTTTTADILVTFTHSSNTYYTTWSFLADIPATTVGATTAITVASYAGSSVLKTQQRTRGLIAYDSSYLTGLDPNSNLVALLNSMATTGYTLQAYTWSDSSITATTSTKLATGTKIVKYNSSGKIVHIYYLVLFGDVTGSGVVGDGVINSQDSQTVLNNINNNLVLGDISALAADVDHNGVIAEADASLILKYYVGTGTINQNYTIANEISDQCYFGSSVVF